MDGGDVHDGDLRVSSRRCKPCPTVWRLVVMRHGNTFERGETPTRVGARTDLPLTAEGRAQARRAADYMAAQGWTPVCIRSAPLARTRESAEIVLNTLMGVGAGFIEWDDRLTEIDYGPDENRPEAEVEERLGRLRLGADGAVATVEAAREAGRAVLEAWNRDAIPPPGWLVDPAALARRWQEVASSWRAEASGGTLLVVTSNGVARFAATLLSGEEAAHPAGAAHLKIAPGALCALEWDAGASGWHCPVWNARP